MTEAIPTHAIALSFDPCWFDAPCERSPYYFPTFARISVALQATLRRALPELYLTDVEGFRNTRMIYPLLVYAASRPFNGQPRTEFTYDVLNQSLMRRFYFSVGQNLPAILAQVSKRLREAGRDEIAKHYWPGLAREIIATVDRLKVCRRRLEALLITETRMVNSLILFAGSKSLRSKARTRIMVKCEKVWLSRLRRLFARQDFTVLGPEILAAATDALKSQLDRLAQAA